MAHLVEKITFDYDLCWESLNVEHITLSPKAQAKI